MNNNLHRNKVYDLSLLKDLKPKWGKNEYLEIDGVLVKITSQRYQVFNNSIICCDCGLKASHLASERDVLLDTDKYHMNMYGIDENGEEVLFTKDHIKPKSKGGRDHILNYQTMCTVCNSKKGNIYEE